MMQIFKRNFLEKKSDNVQLHLSLKNTHNNNDIALNFHHCLMLTWLWNPVKVTETHNHEGIKLSKYCMFPKVDIYHIYNVHENPSVHILCDPEINLYSRVQDKYSVHKQSKI